MMKRLAATLGFLCLLCLLPGCGEGPPEFEGFDYTVVVGQGSQEVERKWVCYCYPSPHPRFEYREMTYPTVGANKTNIRQRKVGRQLAKSAQVPLERACRQLLNPDRYYERTSGSQQRTPYPKVTLDVTYNRFQWNGENHLVGYLVTSYGPVDPRIVKVVTDLNRGLPAAIRRTHGLRLPPEAAQPPGLLRKGRQTGREQVKATAASPAGAEES